jgi:hypothetical protein
MKYFIDTEQTRKWKGHTLYRIIPYDHEDLGGWIETKEVENDILTQYGPCMAWEGTMLLKGARLFGYAQAWGHGIIEGTVGDQVHLYGFYHIGRNAVVGGFAKIIGTNPDAPTTIGDYAQVHGEPAFILDSEIRDNAVIWGEVEVIGSKVTGAAKIEPSGMNDSVLVAKSTISDMPLYTSARIIGADV